MRGIHDSSHQIYWLVHSLPFFNPLTIYIGPLREMNVSSLPMMAIQHDVADIAAIVNRATAVIDRNAFRGRAVLNFNYFTQMMIVEGAL